MSNKILLIRILLASVGLTYGLTLNGQAGSSEKNFQHLFREVMAANGFKNNEIALRSFITGGNTTEAGLQRLSLLDLFKPLSEVAVFQPQPSKTTPPLLIFMPGIATDFAPSRALPHVTTEDNQIDNIELSAEMKERVNIYRLLGVHDELIAHIMVLRFPELSSDSFLPLPTGAEYLKTTIDKAWQALGEQEFANSTYIVGYSRGGLFALEMLSAIEQGTLKKSSWYKTRTEEPVLKGLVTLATPLAGSLTDVYNDQSLELEKIANRIDSKLALLKPDFESFEENYQLLFVSNDLHGSKEPLFVEMMNVANQISSMLPVNLYTTINLNNLFNGHKSILEIPGLTDPRIKKESHYRDLRSLLKPNMQLISKIITKYTGNGLILAANTEYKACANHTCRQKVKKDYKNVILQIKKLKNICYGLLSLSKEKNNQKWTKMRLPNHLRYLSIATSMPAPIDDFLAQPKSGYEQAYESTGTADGMLARVSYYAIADKLGRKLNDGFVPVSGSILRENYLKTGTGQDYQVDFLGVIGANHFNVVYDEVFPSPNNWPKSTLRPINQSLLQSIVYYLRQPNTTGSK